MIHHHIIVFQMTKWNVSNGVRAVGIHVCVLTNVRHFHCFLVRSDRASLVSQSVDCCIWQPIIVRRLHWFAFPILFDDGVGKNDEARVFLLVWVYERFT